MAALLAQASSFLGTYSLEPLLVLTYSSGVGWAHRSLSSVV